MTPYDDIIDLALLSIEDYRINRLAKYIDQLGFDVIISSTNYVEYIKLCEDNDIAPIKEKEYNAIVSKGYEHYQEYVDDSLADLKLVIEGFMVRGIPNFTNCKKDLANRSDELRVFNEPLTDLEKSIVADWTVLAWLTKEINDVRQITGMIQNKTEANRYSEANLLNAKTSHKTQLQEDVNKKQTEYDFLNIPWSDWARGEYGI